MVSQQVRARGAYDVQLTYSGVSQEFMLARDPQSNDLLYKSGIMPEMVDRFSTSAFSYEHRDPSIDLPASFEDFSLGAGFEDAPDTTALGSRGYNYTQGVDLSRGTRGYLSHGLQTAGSALTTTGAKKVLLTSLGLFAINDGYVYRWSGSAWTNVLTAPTVVNDIFEFTNAVATYVVVGMAGDQYYYSTNGTTFIVTEATATAPAFRSASTAYAAAATSITATEPAGATTNDILLMLVSTTTATTITANVTSFWNVLATPSDATGSALLLWGRRTGSAPDYVVNFGGSVASTAVVVAYSGSRTTGTPIDVLGALTVNASGTSHTIAAATTTGENRKIIGALASSGYATVTPPGSTTERAEGLLTTTQTFNYTGSAQSFVVPANITTITVDVQGGEGNATKKGGRVQATLTGLTPGETLNIYVGEQGAVSGSTTFGGGGASGGKGSSGGGASDIRKGGTALADRIVVAGGAGGYGTDAGETAQVLGGVGGGTTGGNGTPGTLAGSGQGGTSSAGGAGGTGNAGTDGGAGSLGTGGNAGGSHAGGGGGGYYGGGGGESGGTYSGSGGGGSSYANGTYASGVTHTQDYRSGNGVITVSYLAAPLAYFFDATSATAIAYGPYTATTSTSVPSGTVLLALKPVQPTGAYDVTRWAARGQSSGAPVLWGISSTGSIRNATLVTTPSNWSATDTIQVGQRNATQNGLEVIDNVFYLVHNGGITSYDGTTVSTVFASPFADPPSNVARPIMSIDNHLFLTYGNALLQFEKSTNTLEKVWPRGPQEGNTELNGTITAMTANEKFIWFALKNSAGNYYIMQIDHHRSSTVNDDTFYPAHTIAYRGSNAVTAMAHVNADPLALSTTNPQLIITNGLSVGYFILPRSGLRPEDDSNCAFDTTADRVAYGSFVSMRAQAFPKWLTRGDIEAKTTATETIAMQYQVPAGSATALVTANAAQTGRTTAVLTTPVTFTRVRYKLLFNTAGATTTPVLRGVVLHAAPNAPRDRGFVFTVVLRDDQETNIPGARSRYQAASQDAFLFSAVNQIVTLRDLLGNTYTTKVLGIQPASVRFDKDGAVEQRLEVTLAQLTS